MTAHASLVGGEKIHNVFQNVYSNCDDYTSFRTDT